MVKCRILKYGVAIAVLSVFSSYGNAKTRVAVSSFKDKTARGRCNANFWGGRQLSNGFRDQIATALLKSNRVSVVERENLKKMYSEEHELINADRRTQPIRNRFKAAHYSITGAVTQFEMCAGGLGGALDVGRMFGIKNTGLKLGGKKVSAKVVIDMRVVDTETGEVILSFEESGKSSKSGFDLNGNYKGAGFATGAFQSSPIGKATQIAISKAVKQILAKLPEREDSSSGLADRGAANDGVSNGRSQAVRGTPERIQAAKSRVTNVCELGNTSTGKFQSCKVLALSKTGKRAKVLNNYTGKVVNINTEKVFKLNKGVTNPTIGKSYLVNSYESGMFTYSKKYSNVYKECVVSDTFDQDFVFNCQGKEFSLRAEQMYSRASLNSMRKKRNTASK